MNRKNTILIAVMINAGLLAVLLIAALTTQEEVVPENSPVLAEAPFTLPPFDDRSLFNETAALPVDTVKTPILEIPVTEPTDPLVHKLPAIVVAPEPVAAPVIAVATSSASEVTVKKGETLEKIAKSNHTSVNELIKINHLPNSFLKVGQVLKIPAEKALAKAPAAPKKMAEKGPEYYTMKVGENPWAIAMKHHMKVEELLRLNGLNEDKARKLKAGDRLRIR